MNKVFVVRVRYVGSAIEGLDDLGGDIKGEDEGLGRGYGVVLVHTVTLNSILELFSHLFFRLCFFPLLNETEM